MIVFFVEEMYIPGMRILDLFSGTGSITKTMRDIFGNCEVVSVDIDPKFEPTIVCDILKLDYKSLWKPRHFDIVWLSPPCTMYSRARTHGTRDYRLSDRMVKRGMAIVEYLKPRVFAMENPAAGLRLRPFMHRWERYVNTVDYCQYSTPEIGDVYMYKKPTCIWTNNKSFQPRRCVHGSRCDFFDGRRHFMTSQKGPSEYTGKSNPVSGSVKGENVYQVPKALIMDVFCPVINPVAPST